MEPLFAVRMTHDEDMYYNQVLASKQSAPAEKPGKKNFLSRVDLSDVIFGLLAFFVFYMTFPAEELAQRIVQSALMAGVFVLVLGQLNGNRRREKQRIAPDADERNQAEMIMESSGLAGEPCTVFLLRGFIPAGKSWDHHQLPVRGRIVDQGDRAVLYDLLDPFYGDPGGKGWLLQGHSQPVQSLSGEKMPEDHYESQIRK